MRVYGAYLFTTKDPVIDELRTMVQDTYGRLNMKVLHQIERDGGASAGAMKGWFMGDTKRPTSPAIEATGRAMGWERRWARMSADDRAKAKRTAERELTRRRAERKSKRKKTKR